MPFPSSLAVRELPIFPLPEVVLFPRRPIPLHIFEFRYRIMMSTIFESDRRFGVLMWDPDERDDRPVSVAVPKSSDMNDWKTIGYGLCV